MPLLTKHNSYEYCFVFFLKKYFIINIKFGFYGTPRHKALSIGMNCAFFQLMFFFKSSFNIKFIFY
jgi:hypothetical protein